MMLLYDHHQHQKQLRVIVQSRIHCTFILHILNWQLFTFDTDTSNDGIRELVSQFIKQEAAYYNKRQSNPDNNYCFLPLLELCIILRLQVWIPHIKNLEGQVL